MGVDYTSIPRKDESEVVQVLYDYDDDDSHTALDDDVEYYNIHNHNGSNRLNQRRRCSSSQLYENVRNVLYLVLLVLFGLILGICVGRKHPSGSGHAGHGMGGMGSGNGNGLLPQQAFVPEIPTKEVQFQSPTAYEDVSIDGDKLWHDLMPIGAGFVRVPYPRRYDMPVSKAMENDPEEAEIYSISGLHQLHCLGVLRDVIKKYEVHSKSRFAGAGHEYHCIDYLRQSIMCSGDTTLDYAEMHEDGTRTGFSGAGSTHQCRDWNAIVEWAVENRAGNRTGIA